MSRKVAHAVELRASSATGPRIDGTVLPRNGIDGTVLPRNATDGTVLPRNGTDEKASDAESIRGFRRV